MNLSDNHKHTRDGPLYKIYFAGQNETPKAMNGSASLASNSRRPGLGALLFEVVAICDLKAEIHAENHRNCAH